jgi:hypothetical protein
VKRITVIFALVIFSLAVFLPLSLQMRTASAQDAGYNIQHVDHQVEVMYTGHVVIRDTIQVTGQSTGGFLIGFPYKYGSHLLKGVAYNANSTLPMSLGVSLEERSGFYGASVSLPQSSPQVFTVMFILSNDLVSYDSTTGAFSLDFPAYPSFATEAADCNVTLVVPGGAASMTVSKDDGTVYASNFVKENLAAFTYSPALASFISSSGLQIVHIKELDRTITISPLGDIVASDSYSISSNSPNSVGSLAISVPPTASNIAGKDELGRTLAVEDLITNSSVHLVNVTFISSLNSNESTMVTAQYTLPHLSPEQITRFALNLDLFPYFDYYVDKAYVTIVPPEGARFLTPQLSLIDPSLSLNREIFQETLSINRQGISYVDEVFPSQNALQITYEYNPLWLSFRPTLWIWTLAVIGSIVVAFWRRPKPSEPLRIVVPKLPIGLSADHVRNFTEAYEERNRITSELRSLDTRAQKGRIPRRRYKVQRRTLEVRFDALSKNINELKETFHRAGGVYTDLTRQLDAAETEIDQAEINIRSIEARQRRGELSLEEYRKFLADYQRRKEKAETAINGILLRLREEIR